MVQARYSIGGDRAAAGSLGTVTNRSPYDGTEVGTAPVSGPDEAFRALEAAHGAFTTWRHAPRADRRALLLQIADGVKSRSEDLARLMALEVGKPIAFARAEVARLEVTFRLAAALLERPAREELALDLDQRGKDYRCFVEREPRGVVFGIVPWNWPFNLAAHKLAPAIAAGCTVVLKPSHGAAVSTFALDDVVHEAGCPDGVLNTVLCENEVAEQMAQDPRVAHLSFTGSPKVGWHLKRLVPEKHVSLELGGDASALVFDDADLDWAVKRTALGKYGYAGQICIAIQHARVQAGVYGRFRDAIVAAAEATPYGDPMKEDTVCGPLFTSEAADRVMEWIAEAENAGGRVLAGGNRIGNVIEPTVVEDVPDGCRLAREEVFGPVLTLSRFGTDEEAIAQVNASRFGIQCGAFTADQDRAERLYRSLEVGGVIVNDYPTLRFDTMPYGGVKQSGFGREGVRYAYDEMTVPKTLVVLR
jgi:acyl-CoA reductase-like NAD-dependent aldehyde dehydrogenase